MVDIYVYENFPQPAVIALRELGHDVLTTVESGKSGQAISDAAVLAYAKELSRVLVTLNRKHFIRLHYERPDHAGIVVCTVDVDFVALAQRIHATLVHTGDITGKLLRINRPLHP